MPGALPPLAEEDHVCEVCRMSYASLGVDDAVERIRDVPAAVRHAVAAVGESRRHTRPDAHTWSVTEYVCHVRDVYVSSTIRLYRVRTEQQPTLEPMLNDLRVVRFRYNEREVDAVLDELEDDVAGFCDEVARVRPDGWDRTATRQPHELRTARWLVRQALHEGTHHVLDIADVSERLASPDRSVDG